MGIYFARRYQFEIGWDYFFLFLHERNGKLMDRLRKREIFTHKSHFLIADYCKILICGRQWRILFCKFLRTAKLSTMCSISSSLIAFLYNNSLSLSRSARRYSHFALFIIDKWTIKVKSWGREAEKIISSNDVSPLWDSFIKNPSENFIFNF
jgi:hypothetical protein